MGCGYSPQLILQKRWFIVICIKCKKNVPDGPYCCLCGKKQAPEKRKALKRSNGMGTAYKLSGRRKRPWIASRNKTVIGYYETKTAALEALEKLSGKLLDERYNMTFAEVYDSWVLEHKQDVTDRVLDAYQNSFNIFAPLHKKKFREIRTADYQSVIDSLIGKSKSTLSKHKQLINQMSVWAIREEIVTQNFAQFVRLPQEEKKEKSIFTSSEINKLIENGSETAQIILMLIGTGMRINELFSLLLVNYHETYVIGGEKTDAGRNRVIPIAPKARPFFAHFVEKATGAALLSGYDGNKDIKNFRNRDYYPLLEKLGIERKTPHATRHTFASRAAASGMKPEVLQKILGHADFSTTANIYIHQDIDTLVSSTKDCW